MPEQRNAPASPFLRAAGTVLGFLLRLLFVLVIGVLIGVGLFYGVPWLYQRFVWPIQENTARITILEEQVAKNSRNIFDHQRTLEDRIVALETEVGDLRKSVAAQRQDHTDLTDETQRLARRITALEDDLRDQRQSVEQLRSEAVGTRSDLEKEIEGIEAELEEAQEELAQQLTASERSLTSVEDQLNSTMGRLALLQTAQDLLKVRLLLVEENPGTARDTLQLAVAHLDRAASLMPSQSDMLNELRARMLSVEELITDGSFRTRPTLEALWADVMSLVVPLQSQSVVTETQAASPLPTPSP